MRSRLFAAILAFGLLFALESSRVTAYTESQYERGLRIYEASCIKCHGPNGEGDPDSGVPAHTGERIQGKFKTMQNMAAFIQAAMPADKPGSLSMEDAYAVSARIMALNGWQPDGVELNAETAPQLTLRGAPAPVEPAPAEPAPAEPAPAEPAPAEPAPAEPAPAEPAPAGPAPAEPAPAEPAPPEPAPAEPAPPEPAPAEPAPVEPAPGRSAWLMWPLLGAVALAGAAGVWWRRRAG